MKSSVNIVMIIKYLFTKPEMEIKVNIFSDYTREVGYW